MFCHLSEPLLYPPLYKRGGNYSTLPFIKGEEIIAPSPLLKGRAGWGYFVFSNYIIKNRITFEYIISK
jgi:hypothetical protein